MRTEASWVPEPLTTRHTYSPESAGVTWGNRSLEPCTWEGQQGGKLRARHRDHRQAPAPFLGPPPSLTQPAEAQGRLFCGEAPFTTLQFPCLSVRTGSRGRKWGSAFSDVLGAGEVGSVSSFDRHEDQRGQMLGIKSRGRAACELRYAWMKGCAPSTTVTGVLQGSSAPHLLPGAEPGGCPRACAM